MPSLIPVAARSKNDPGDKARGPAHRPEQGPGEVHGAIAEAIAPWLLAVLAVVAVTGFDPFGWDHFGPIRWMALPALGFAAIALSIERTHFGGPAIWNLQSGVGLGHLWAGLLAWGFVATLTAADPLHAWIGTPDRRFGWSTWLLCGGLFLVCRGTEIDRRGPMIEKVTRFVAVGGIGLGLYTVAELADLAFDIDFAGNRAGGPFGQPAYLGAAAVLVLPIAIGVFAENRHRQVWGLAGLGGAVGAGVALLASQSRAAWLGGLVAAAAWLALRLLGQRGQARSANTGARIASAAVVIVPVLTILAVPRLRSRLTSILGEGGVAQGRIDEWQVGLRAIADAPLLGYGPEGYRTVFGRHVDEQYVIDWGRDVITDRAHAGLIDVGLIFGIPGALLYLALMVAVVVAAIRAMGGAQPTTIALGAATLAYVVQQQFFFPISEIDPLFWIVAGLTIAATKGTDSVAHGASPPLAAQLGRGLAMGLAIVALVAGLADMAANVAVRSALSGARDTATATAATTEVETAILYRPDSIRYRFITARLMAGDGDLERAIDQIERGLQRSAADPALNGERARLLLERARVTAPGPTRTERLSEAVAALETLVEDDPNHPEHLQRLGIALALSGEFDDAVSVMERAVALAPDQPEPTQNLSEIERLRQSEQDSDNG